MKKLLYLLLVLPVIALSQTPSQNQNYVTSTAYQKGFVKGQESTATAKDKTISVQYFDGLGRPIQNVAVKAGGQSQDIITHFEYDAFGRQVKDYLPYTSLSNGGAYRTNGFDATNSFYDATKYESDFPGMTIATINPYSEKRFENSPLNRILEQTAPGASWKLGTTFNVNGHSDGHAIKFGYESNTATEVRLYTVSLTFANNTYTPTLQGGSAYYQANELYKSITKDENWISSDGLNRTTEEFKDKQGRVLLKRTYNAGVAHDTYYVYDDYGNLTYVLPPKAEPHYQKPDTTEMLELCYQYKYDNRNRLVEKKIPGKGWESIVYNRLDQPIMTQDAKLDAQNKWLFTKYDKLGRIAYTGFSNTGASRTSLQAAVNNSTQMWVSRGGAISLGGAVSYYNNAAYPATVSEIHSFNYYDDYYFDKSGLIVPSKSYGIDIVNYNNASATKILTRGLATGSKIKVLGQNGHWVTTINGYDSKSRLIWVGSYNSYLQITDIIENKLDDFTGRVLETKATHKKTGKADVLTIDTFEYDHIGRLVEQNQYINNNEGELIARNYYDDLGQLEKKDVGGSVASSTTSAITSTNYIDLVGVSVSGTEVTSTAGTGWNNSGFATAENFSGDGFVEYEIPQTGKYIMVGLSTDNTNAHYNTIDYAVYHNSTNRVYVYESGSYKGNFTTYQVGDHFKIERLGNTVYYKKNNVTFYTSTITSTGSLLGDITFYQNSGKIKDLEIVGSEPVYKDLLGVSISGTEVTSTAANGWGNSGFATVESISGDGYIEYNVPQTNAYSVVGLSTSNLNGSHVTIEYGIYNNGRYVRVMENGTNKGSFGIFAANDIFKIERIGSTIFYKKNGQTFYTSTIPSTGALIADVSIHSNLAKIKDLKIVSSAPIFTELNALQTIDYTYNVRGWLKGINDVNNPGDDLFTFNMRYDDPTSGTALYNGNISQTFWKTKNTDQSLKNYKYSFDALNRIKTAIDNTRHYDLNTVNYDKNGNITYLSRDGHKVTSPDPNNGAHWGQTDAMTYYYSSKSNKLHRVRDASNDTKGFTELYDANNEITYDVNGNMKKDLNKNISNINYNHLNLPTQVTINGQNINYVYDATGTKLRKIVSNTTTDYAGNYIYENNNLQFFSHPEGYVQNTNGEFSYVYQYKDHLGNVRLSYADNDNDGHITDAGLFSDGLENSSGWDSNGALYGLSATIDTQRSKSGSHSAKLTLSGAGDLFAHSNEWIPINNSVATDYIFSGWVYLESSSNAYARILLFMNEDDETGYSTQVSDTDRLRTKGQWVYIEKQVTVPANIDKLNLRIDVYTSYASGATAWFDDLQIKKVGASEIVAENNYYPFGLKHKGYNDVTNPGGNSVANRYGYNGKELQDEIVGGKSLQWYDYGARNYDASLGRWMNLDPLSEKYSNISPYSYVANNVVNAIDPDGKLIIFINGLRTEKGNTDQRTWSKDYGIFKGTTVNSVTEYWSSDRNTFGKATSIDNLFMNYYSDTNAYYTSGSSTWRSTAKVRESQGAEKAKLFDQKVKSGEITLEEGETIKVVSHSQGGAHSVGFINQLMTYKDEDGNSVYNIEIVHHITPHQPKDISATDGVESVQYSHPNDAISSDAPWWLPNGGSIFGMMKGITTFYGTDIMGGQNQPPCGGASGNRCGHNVNDNYNYILTGLVNDFCKKNPGKCTTK